MNFFDTYISQNSIKFANDVLKSSFISAGKLADEFEHRIEEKIGLVNAVSLNSGTSALYLALAVAGIQPGDEVILPPQTFIATGLSILMHNAVPVFADIQYNTGNIDPESIKLKISEKTKAVIPVHWGGYPCNLDEINGIAKDYGLAVIEDAAHALGATYKEKPIGAVSRFTAFSFQAIKHLTTGDGGALCCLNQEDYYQARRRRWFDIDRENARPSLLGEREYDAVNVGYKLHMNDLAAAIGIGNLDDFSNNLMRRREIASLYIKELKNVAGIEFLDYKNDRQSACWLFTMLVEERKNFITALQNKGIPASVVHLRIDKNSVFGGIQQGLTHQEKFNERQVSIPVHSSLKDEDVKMIIDAVKEGW